MASPGTTPDSSAQPQSPQTETLPLKDRISALYERLVASAELLNSASDELAAPIATIDLALKNLNLGIETWVNICGEVDSEYDRFWDREIGYAKISGEWCLAIRMRQGFYDDYGTEHWRFSDAPRAYRLEATDKLPDLLEQLLATATETADKLKKKVDTTKEIAEAVAKSLDLRRRLIEEIRRQDPSFHNTIVVHSTASRIKGDRVWFTFSPQHKALREAFEKKNGWMSDLLSRLAHRPMTVGSKLAEQASKE